MVRNDTTEEKYLPRILVFSTNNISDPGIDLAGSSHMHYRPSVVVISLPCTSGIKPGWIIRALERGFEGVFIAADGEECAYLADCTERSGRIVARAQELFQEKGFAPQRLRMAAVCSTCAESFTKQIKEFSELLKDLNISNRPERGRANGL